MTTDDKASMHDVEIEKLEYLNHPRPDVDRFVKGYKAAGGKLQLEFFTGPAYDLIRTGPGSEEATRCIKMLAGFVKKHTVQ